MCVPVGWMCGSEHTVVKTDRHFYSLPHTLLLTPEGILSFKLVVFDWKQFHYIC